MKIILKRSSRSGKKYMVKFEDGVVVHFGASGYSDYTKHKNPDRKKNYISRHGGNKSGTQSRREKWGKNGIKTAGFWSRWLLWGEPTLQSSIKEIERRFNVKIYKR